MNRSFDVTVRANKLPVLRVVTTRSTSAKFSNEENLTESMIEDSTPYFKHSCIASCVDDVGIHNDLSLLCLKILKEQNQLKQKISLQARMIEKIYKKKPPIPTVKNKKAFLNQENKEITFFSFEFPESAKFKKKFRFPRDVFSSKNSARQV